MICESYMTVMYDSHINSEMLLIYLQLCGAQTFLELMVMGTIHNYSELKSFPNPLTMGTKNVFKTQILMNLQS